MGTGDKLGDKNESQLRTALPLKLLRLLPAAISFQLNNMVCDNLSLIYNLGYSEKLSFQFSNTKVTIIEMLDRGQGGP